MHPWGPASPGACSLQVEVGLAERPLEVLGQPSRHALGHLVGWLLGTP